MAVNVPVNCKKCRKILFSHPDHPLLSIHGSIVNSESKNKKPCLEGQQQPLWYLDSENVPSWITSVIEEAGWTKGKLHCPVCHCRVGTFDFVSGGHCPCQLCVIPPVHLIKSKVDVFFHRGELQFEANVQVEDTLNLSKASS
ncbi:hypothetical protein J437_LFUL007598 [Ladona fulva]|uniref:Uncharacterized protein n=1 Tax=Ladona fulva TaxID=123851 RepID=A0A8K0K6Z6_LADFU|nr:hypothetical protein J437_LFUL007598 [Ladona fulva]